MQDEDYSPEFEGQSVHGDSNRALERLLKTKGFDLYLLADLQKAHDSAMPLEGQGYPHIDSFEDAMRFIAENWNLKYTQR